MITVRLCNFFSISALSALICGCADQAEPTAIDMAPPVMRAEPSDEPEIILPSELRHRLRANENAKFQKLGNEIVEAELFQSGIKTIDALRGIPLRSLDLGMTEVSDLQPLIGMPLKRLILENTPVEDISPLKGMQLEVLHLQNTKVTDVSVLNGMPIRELNLLSVPVRDLNDISQLPLETLWIPRTGVSDISQLKGKPMVSLDIQATEVSTIEALAGMTTLRRLNIANTPVTDVSPLKGLKLERITLTPETIKTGMEVLREMPSLKQILTTMYTENRQSSVEFWQKYDAGVWKDPPADPASPETKDPPHKTGDTEANGAHQTNKAPAKSESRPDAESNSGTNKEARSDNPPSANPPEGAPPAAESLPSKTSTEENN